MATRSEVRDLRAAQSGIARLVDRDLRAQFARLNLSEPRRARDAMLTFAPVVVNQYAEIAASFGLDWYESTRAAARVRAPFIAPDIDTDYTDQTVGTVRRVAGDLFTDHPRTAIESLSSKGQMYAVNGARDAIAAAAVVDVAARGWRRVTSGNSCEFCNDLATETHNSPGADFEAHDGCNCIAVPAF